MKNGIIIIFCFCIVLTTITLGCISQNSNPATTITPTPTIDNDAWEAVQSADEVLLSIENISNTIAQYDIPLNSHINELTSQTQTNQYNFPLLQNIFQTDLDNVDRLPPLLNDVNITIRKFSEDTIKWHGDTRTYAEQASNQMQVIYNDINNQISTERELISNIKLYVDSTRLGRPNENYFKMKESSEKLNNYRMQMNKDKDLLRSILKKIEQLQN
jgi:hypothetical protein